MVSLETYDPQWEERFDRAQAAWTRAREAGDSVAAVSHTKAMHAAFHAQFRTADDYRDHRLRFDPAVDSSAGLVPDIPDGLSLDEVRRRLDAWHESVLRTEAEADRPPRRDPVGLEAFLTPASPGVHRFSDWFTLDGTNSRQRTMTCQIAVEYSDTTAHVCFITTEARGSVTNNVEDLATQFCRTWVRQPTPLRRLLGLRHPGEYKPSDLAFYDYLPWRVLQVDDFDQVRLEWSAQQGFHSPAWTSFETVPPYLADLADYRTAPAFTPPRALADRSCTASQGAAEIVGSVRTDAR